MSLKCYTQSFDNIPVFQFFFFTHQFVFDVFFTSLIADHPLLIERKKISFENTFCFFYVHFRLIIFLNST